MSPRMIALAQSQDKIGYCNFMEGNILTHFYEIQNFHLAMTSSFLNGTDWAKQFISKILHILHSQWIFRNFSLHDKRNGYLHNKKAEKIALELESLAGLAPEDVPANSQFLLESHPIQLRIAKILDLGNKRSPHRTATPTSMGGREQKNYVRSTGNSPAEPRWV